MARKISENELTRSKETVFRLFKYRPRSEKEIREKLEMKAFSQSIIEKTIEYFKGKEHLVTNLPYML